MTPAVALAEMVTVPTPMAREKNRSAVLDMVTVTEEKSAAVLMTGVPSVPMSLPPVTAAASLETRVA